MRVLKLSVSFDSSALEEATVLRSGWMPGSIPESGLPKRAPYGSLERSLLQGWIVLLPQERPCLFKSTSHPYVSSADSPAPPETMATPERTWWLPRQRAGKCHHLGAAGEV